MLRPQEPLHLGDEDCWLAVFKLACSGEHSSPWPPQVSVISST